MTTILLNSDLRVASYDSFKFHKGSHLSYHIIIHIGDTSSLLMWHSYGTKSSPVQTPLGLHIYQRKRSSFWLITFLKTFNPAMYHTIFFFWHDTFFPKVFSVQLTPLLFITHVEIFLSHPIEFCFALHHTLEFFLPCDEALAHSITSPKILVLMAYREKIFFLRYVASSKFFCHHDTSPTHCIFSVSSPFLIFFPLYLFFISSPFPFYSSLSHHTNVPLKFFSPRRISLPFYVTS
jgi:hypothetical protein